MGTTKREEGSILAAEHCFGAVVRRQAGWIEIAFQGQSLRLPGEVFWNFMELMSKAARELAAMELQSTSAQKHRNKV